MAASQTSEVSWTWAQSWQHRVIRTGKLCIWLPCVPTAWSKPTCQLGVCTRGDKVSFYSVIWWWLIDDFYRWMYALILTIDGQFLIEAESKRLHKWSGTGWWVGLLGWVSTISAVCCPLWAPSGDRSWYFLSFHTSWSTLQPNLCDSDIWAADHTAKANDNTVFQWSRVGGVVCGHHTLVHKNGMGSLKKGEWYIIIIIVVTAWIVGWNVLVMHIWTLSFSCHYSLLFLVFWHSCTIYVVNGPAIS